MESSRTTLDTEESSRLTVKPSSTVLRPVNALLAERKGPQYNREIVDRVEEALKSNDFWTTSQWLQVLKEEFSRNDQWPPDVVDRIWKCVINALRGSTDREVKTPNCELSCFYVTNVLDAKTGVSNYKSSCTKQRVLCKE